MLWQSSEMLFRNYKQSMDGTPGFTWLAQKGDYFDRTGDRPGAGVDKCSSETGKLRVYEKPIVLQ